MAHTAPSPSQPVAPSVVYVRSEGFIRRKDVLVNYNAGRTAKRLGIAKIMMGVVSVVFNGIGILLEQDDYGGTYIFNLAFGIWCPVFYWTSGGLAVCSSSKRTVALIRALCGMSIMSVLSGVMQFWAFTAATVELSRGRVDSNAKACMTLSVFLLLIGLAEVVLAFGLCKLSGHHVCCASLVTTADGQLPIQYVAGSHQGDSPSAQGTTNPQQHAMVAGGANMVHPSPVLVPSSVNSNIMYVSPHAPDHGASMKYPQQLGLRGYVEQPPPYEEHALRTSPESHDL